MLDITFATFETEVIAASHQQPVLIDFWAPWCAPCKALGPILEKLEQDYAGRFMLAKVNADIEQQLVSAFGIRSLPTCVLMVNGQAVDGFQGALPASQIQAFLDTHLPQALPTENTAPEEASTTETSPSDELNALCEQAQAKPEDDAAQFAWIKSLIQQGDAKQAQTALGHLGARVSLHKGLSALALCLEAHNTWPEGANTPQAKTQYQSPMQDIQENKRNFAARFAKAQYHAVQQNWTDALDELLEILMRDKTWLNDSARKTYIGLLELIETPPSNANTSVAGQIPVQNPTWLSYQRRLSSIILS